MKIKSLKFHTGASFRNHLSSPLVKLFFYWSSPSYLLSTCEIHIRLNQRAILNMCIHFICSVPLGFSLFNGYLSNLPAGPGNSGDPNNICSCGESDLNCGANVINSALDPSLAYLVGQTGPLGVNQRVRRSSTSQEGQPGTFNINPRVPRSWNSSQNYPTDQDSSNDNVDYEYDAQRFNYSFGKNDSLPTFSWPAPNNMTEAQATEYCRKLLWDNSNIRQLCSGVVSPSDVSGVISQCVLDIKVI